MPRSLVRGSGPAIRFMFTKACIAKQWISGAAHNAHQGQPGARIRIIAWPKEVIKIKGSDAVAGWKEYNRDLRAAIVPDLASAARRCMSRRIGPRHAAGVLRWANR